MTSLPPPPPRRTAADVAMALPRVHAHLAKENEYKQWPEFAASVHLLLAEADSYRKAGNPEFDEPLTRVFFEVKQFFEAHEMYYEQHKGPYRFTTAMPPKVTFPQRLAPYTRDLPDYDPARPGPGQGRLPPTYTSLIPRPDEVMDPPFRHWLPSYKGGFDWACFFKRPESMASYRDYLRFGLDAREMAKITPTSSSATATTPAKRMRVAVANMSKTITLTRTKTATGTSTTTTNPLVAGVDFAEMEKWNMAQVEFAWFHNLVHRDLNEMITHAEALFAPNANLSDRLRFALERGFFRAMTMNFLQLMTNSENRDINTPWRRVVFPAKREKFKTIHFNSIALPRREKANPMSGMTVYDRHVRFEPAPWVYWYNEWRREADFVSAWSRKRYNGQYWDNFKQIALPINYNGPHTFDPKCVYDKHWLTMGPKLVALQEVLEKLNVTHRRRLLQDVVLDMRDGVEGLDIPVGVVARPGVDSAPHKDTGVDQFLLVDEVDMAWLKLLTQPPTTKELSGLSPSNPEDTLTIILDHRLQSMFNDVQNNPFWVIDQNKGARQEYRARQISLEHLLPMINLGGREIATREWDQDSVTHYHAAPRLNATGAQIPNNLYQFSLKELMLHCSKLAEMGRIAYKRPENPDEFQGLWWSGKGMLYYYPDPRFASRGGFIVPVPPGVDPLTNFNLGTDTYAQQIVYPEERIRWCYEDDQANRVENWNLRRLYATHLFNRDKTPATATGPLRTAQDFEDDFEAVSAYKTGPGAASDSIEARRQSPSWGDLVDYRLVIAQNAAVPSKTSNFLRVLAYRAGRTIRHFRALQRRTALPSALKRAHLNAAIRDWRIDTVVPLPGHDPRRIGVSLPLVEEVIGRVDDKHPALASTDRTEVYRAIREGIVEDMVQNRVMLYPSRRTLYTDKAGGLEEIFMRANIWSWGAEAIRERQAPYRRKRFFDMRRWPVNKQAKESSRAAIRERRDEDPSIQSTSAWFRYGIKVGPQPRASASRGSSTVTELVQVIEDPVRARLCERIGTYVTSEVVKIAGTVADFGPGWQIDIKPPGTVSKDGTKGDDPCVCIAKPILRVKQQFIPGRAVFPMGDTLLQQVKISHDLEKILAPKEERSNIVGDIIGHMADWLTPPSKQIPLVPKMDLTKIPLSQDLGLKRKVPSSFIASDARAPKVQKLWKPEEGVKGEDSDDDKDWKAADDMIPAHLRDYGSAIARTTKRKDGTWRITIGETPVGSMGARGTKWQYSIKSGGGGYVGTSPMGRVLGRGATGGGGGGGPRPLSAAAQAMVAAAKANFDATFPRGYTILPTSGNRLLCALYAIAGSIQSQFPSQAAPTIDELYDHFQNPRDAGIRAQRAATGLPNMNDLGADQAASTLLDWSLHRGTAYQLGVFTPSTATTHMLMGVPTTAVAVAGTVWIQNNATQAGVDAAIRAEAAAARKKGGALTVAEIEGLWAAAPNHYSAMRPS
ncbi:hypothetical protein KJ359_004302 [Pestalotiopsis sp. 9143b]|nr:hypothetical protein KJ359_004302 [Pestalotiopsis sp. 9143b]